MSWTPPGQSGNPRSLSHDALGRVATIDPYYAAAEQLTYDRTGNVIRRTKPDLCVLEQDYDAMGRLVTRFTSNEASCTRAPVADAFGYDARGLLVAARNDDVGLIREYDELGRMLREIDIRFGTGVGYAWDGASRRTSKVYPDGSSVHYAYDGAGRTVGISDPFGDTTRFVYDAAGRRLQKLGTQGLRTEYGYAAGTGWLTGVTSYTSTGSVASAFGYPSHDDVGNRLAMTETNGGATSYSYDALDRLESVDPPDEAIFPANGQKTWFAYDAAGNRTSFGPKDGSTWLSPRTTYAYDVQKRLATIRVDQAHVESFGYDPNGNATSWDPPEESARTLGYDALGRMVSITGSFTASYAYDPFGRRVEKTEQGTTTRYQYDGLDVVAEYSVSQLEATYVFGPGIDEVLKVERGTTVAAYHTDGLGSVVAISEGATLRNTYRYDAFGKPLAPGGSSPLPNAYTYTGRELDASGLYYYRARYYLPSAGRFLTPDPIGLAGGINAYAYVSSNPINYTDPFGLFAGQAFGPAAPTLALSSLGSLAFAQVASQSDPYDPRGFLPDEQWIIDRVINTGGIEDLDTSRVTVDVGSFWTALGVPAGFTPGSEINLTDDYLEWSRERRLSFVVHEAWHARQDQAGWLWPGIAIEQVSNLLPFVDAYALPTALNRNFYEYGREQQAVILQNVAAQLLGVPASRFLPRDQVIQNSTDAMRLWEEMLSGSPEKQ